MLGRVAAAVIAYLIVLFHFQNDMTTVGQLFGLTGFWALCGKLQCCGYPRRSGTEGRDDLWTLIQ